MGNEQRYGLELCRRGEWLERDLPRQWLGDHGATRRQRRLDAGRHGLPVDPRDEPRAFESRRIRRGLLVVFKLSTSPNLPALSLMRRQIRKLPFSQSQAEEYDRDDRLWGGAGETWGYNTITAINTPEPVDTMTSNDLVTDLGTDDGRGRRASRTTPILSAGIRAGATSFLTRRRRSGCWPEWVKRSRGTIIPTWSNWTPTPRRSARLPVCLSRQRRGCWASGFLCGPGDFGDGRFRESLESRYGWNR